MNYRAFGIAFLQALNKISKRGRYQCNSLFSQLSALNLSGTKATRANVHGSVGSVYYSLNPTDVGLPSSVGLAVGVGNVVSERNALAADTALSHFDTSKIPSQRTKILYIIFVNTNRQLIL